jgi:ornithine carbamoyltransferase
MSNDIPANLRALRNFLAISDLKAETLCSLLDLCLKRKDEFRHGRLRPALQNKVLAMIFQKPSLRTRLGFEAAMVQLGGHAINLEEHQIGIGQRENVGDITRVLASMCDGIMARVFAHQLIVELAAHSSKPVINGLSDWSHPCQALADLMTIRERFGQIAGRKLAYIGDGNNVARSLLHACVRNGLHFAIAAPQGYAMDVGTIEAGLTEADRQGVTILQTEDPHEAAEHADVVYTDVWTSMGQEAESATREQAFARFQVNAALMERARPTAIVMHCLPAHRNVEITDEVLDGPQSIVFEQAENRLHSQRTLLEVVMTNKAL